MIKNKAIASALVNGIATMAYTLIILDFKKALSVSIATVLGSLISFYVVRRIEKDQVWIFDIVPNNNEHGKLFADSIRENNVPIMTYIGFDDLKQKMICSKIYSHSKEHSTLIESLIPEGFKYHVNEVKNYIES